MKRVFSIMVIALALSACTNTAKEEAIKQAAVKATKDSLRLDSFKRVEVAQKQLQQQEQAKAKEESEQRQASVAPATASSNSAAAATSKKKGWSDAAKGTVIGAGAGALGGALIGKGKGAVIGGVVGAGTGYVIGRGQDRKSGRVQKKN